jgi:hypothetical protein
MTPIAHLLAKDLTEPVARRRYQRVLNEVNMRDEWHFFECSQVTPAAIPLGQKMLRGIVEMSDRGLSVDKAGRLAFLPAPKTWIEDTHYGATDKVKRMAFLLEETPSGIASVRQLALLRNDEILLCQCSCAGLPLFGSDWLGNAFGIGLDGSADAATAMGMLLYGWLAMINTPRVILRNQHMPHRGLEKRLKDARGLLGHFPLHGWTEIVLKVQPPTLDRGEPHEAHFTGQRALHFVRCHLRIRLGQLELVSAHWRGDAALGIIRSRYRLEGNVAC